MKFFKTTLLAGVLSINMAAPVFANQAPITEPIQQFTAADTQSLFEQDAKPMQLAPLSAQEMKETEGAWWFVALPLARAAIWAAPRISSSFRVVNNTKSQHTILLQNNAHRVQIGIDKNGPHVGWGANSKNNAVYHIYKNDPWKINPY
jgi:hypothetical protein